MKVAEFDFDLPARLIAQHPIRPRDAARLLVIGAAMADKGVRDLPELLAPGDTLVFNDTRVIPARLWGKRGPAAIEATLTAEDAPGRWRAFVRPARRLKIGDEIDFAPGFAARVAEKRDGGEVVLVFDLTGASFRAALARYGAMPLPPYIKRAKGGEPADLDDYQTLFAEKEGAVAAPTAGLHFTPALMAALEARGVGRAFVTLHVGAGTFLPVKVDDTDDHALHAEWGEIPAEAAAAINRTRAHGGRIVAVGTTALRLLEAAADEDGHVPPFAGETDLFITPGYDFRVVERLLTNFHLPRSTLFMLVSAFAGLARMKAAYAHAIENGYRFYSYGDCCLIDREVKT